MIFQSKINKRLDHIGDLIIDKKINIFKFKDMLNKTFSDMGVKVTVEKNKNLQNLDDVFFSGFFDPTMSFEDDEKDIEIVISYYEKYDLILDREKFEKYKFIFSLVLQHELIHRYQQERRGDKSQREYTSNRKSEQYYGNPDEIDARAHDISLEITRNKCYNLLRNPREASLLTSETLFTYVILFDSNSKVFKRLMKKVYQCINLPTCQWKS
jgi:hypothetical protein